MLSGSRRAKQYWRLSVRSDHAFGRLGLRRRRAVAISEELGHEAIRFGDALDFDRGRLDRYLDLLESRRQAWRGCLEQALVAELEHSAEEPQRRNERRGPAYQDDRL